MNTTPGVLARATPATRTGSLRWGRFMLPLSALLVLLLLPQFLSPYLQDLTLRIVIYAIFALSLELLVGSAGLISLGHAAFFGIAAYVTVLSAPEDGPAALGTTLLLAMLAAAAYALVVGALSLRTKGVYFIMVTLAFAQMAYFVFHDTPLGGGSDGIFLNFRPQLALAGTVLIDLDKPLHLYLTAIAALAATYLLLAAIRASRFGHALDGMRVSHQRMRAVGYNTYAYQLAAFVIAAMLAAVAGFLLAVKNGTVNPEFISWHESGAVLLMIILGGLGSLRGAVLGTCMFILLKEFYSSEAIWGALSEHWQLSLGLTMIAFVAFLPDGLIGLSATIKKYRRKGATHG